MCTFAKLSCLAFLALTATIFLPSTVSAQKAETGLVLSVVPNNYNINLTAGKDNQLTLDVRNAGPATATNIRMSADMPEGWQVTFAPPTISTLGVGKNQTVEVNIKPDIAAARTGYTITLIAQANEIQQSFPLYVNVTEASFWIWIGLGLAIIIIGVFVFIFLRFGRQKA